MNPAIIEVPGTSYVVLKDDACLGKWAVESGSIMGEKHLREVPAVQALQPGDVVLDIGAFVDTPAIWLEHGCEVHAWEPYPDAFACLRHNFPTAHLYNAAAGDGTPLQASGEFGEHNQNYGTRMVMPGGTPSMRIDDLWFPAVQLVKIDVEGCELMVLRGMRETLLRCQPTIILEIYDSMLAKHGTSRNEVLDYIGHLGYRWEVCIGRVEDERFDLVAVPE